MQKRIKFPGIRGAIPLAIIATMLVMLLFSTIFIAHKAKSVLLEVRANRIEDIAHSLSSSIFLQLQRVGKDMLIAASMPQVLNGLNIPTTTKSPLAQASQKNSITRPSLNALLNNMKLTFGYYDAFCLLGSNGELIAGNPGKDNFFVQAQNVEKVRETFTRNTFTVGAPIPPNQINDEVLLPVSLKVIYNGHVGAIAGTVQVAKIIKAVLHDSVQEGITTLVLGSNGEIITTMEDVPEIKTFNNTEWFKTLNRKVSGTIKIKVNDQEKTLGFYHIPQINMYVVAIADENYMLSSAGTIGSVAAIIDIASILLVVLAVVFYIFPIARDINKLYTFIDKVSKGEPVDSANINRQDGLGVLAKKMDTMVDTLTGKVGKAEASSKAKSEFIARMSPEIRTPMNGILGAAYLAMKDNSGEPQLEHLKRIDNSAKDLLGIINDILDFSMLESEEIDLSMQSFYLNGILVTVSDILSKKAEEKNITFDFSVDKNVPNILYSDALRVTQICINLCSNAIKFTEKGGVFLHVSKVEDPLSTGTVNTSTSPAMPENSFGLPYIMVENTLIKPTEVPQNAFFLAFTVTDSGEGIPEGKRENLFNSFSHREEYASQTQKSVGLGLSICKSLVHALAGKIGYVSIPNKGSIFTFILPFTEGNIQEPGIQITQQDEDSEIPPIKVLLAEDNKINQEIAIEILSTIGAKTAIASNGEEAFDLWMKQDFDLILMDIEMPVLDGLQATKQIRKSGKGGSNYVPIIAMTANATAIDKERSKAAGMDDHVAKPLDIILLKKTLKYWGKVSLKEKARSIVLE